MTHEMQHCIYSVARHEGGPCIDDCISADIRPRHTTEAEGCICCGCSMHITVQYTKRMGGVDRADQHIGAYSATRRSRRWWLRILYYLLDVAIVNAHILYSFFLPSFFFL